MGLLKGIFYFYVNGFREMKVGKQLWLLILLKLFIMFVIIKLLFFRSKTPNFDNKSDKAIYYREQLTN